MASRFPKRKTRWPAVEQKFFPFKGGLNEVDPQLTMPDGMAIASRNYEVGVRGGYRRIDGYERFNGMFSPSEATYWVIPFDSGGTTEIVADFIVHDASTLSGSTFAGTVLAVELDTGTWAGGDAAGRLVVGRYNDSTLGDPDSFTDNDTIFAEPLNVATVDGAPVERAASSEALDATYVALAIASLRSSIIAVPGSGSVLGVHQYAGVKYAFRNNAGATAAVMHKATADGWEAIDLGGTLAFTSGGTSEPSVGDTITGDTSTETAIITRIQLDSGTWAGGDAAGTIYYRAKSAAFTSGENFDTNNFTMTGAESDVSLTVGGRYRFYNANFTGHSGGIKMYGVDGVNKGFEFDGTAFIQITTGMTTDAPTRVLEHKKQLQYAFSGGSLQQSGIGTPHVWTPITGASELGTADEISDLVDLPGDVMGVFDRNRTYILYGSSGSYDLRDHSDTTGAYPYTVQRMSDAVLLDDRGISTLSQTDRYGDFQDGTISQLVQKTIDAKRELACDSTIVRKKNQYRIFFSDKTALFLTFDDRKVAGFMPIEYDHLVTCSSSQENGAGVEELFFGSDDGFVYQADKGKSFDGRRVRAYFRPKFAHMGNPGTRKDFKSLELEVLTGDDGAATTRSVPAFGYEDGDSAAHRVDEVTVTEVDTLNPLNRRAATFDGLNDWLTNLGYTSAPADGKNFTISSWFNVDDVTAGSTKMIYAARETTALFGTVSLSVTGDTVVLQVNEPGTTNVAISCTTSAGSVVAGKWHHFVLSTDGTNIHAYLDGISVNATAFDLNVAFDHGSITLAADHSTTATVADTTNLFKGKLSDQYMTNEYIDLSVQANLDLIINEGDWVDLGTDGSGFTGSQPIMYITVAGNNLGSGGVFPITGSLVQSSIDLVSVDKTHPRLVVDTQGHGPNMSITVYSNQADESPHTVFGAIAHYINRRRTRARNG